MSEIDDQLKTLSNQLNLQEPADDLRVDPIILPDSKTNVSNSCNEDKIQRKYPDLDRHEDRWVQLFLQRTKRAEELPSSNKNIRIIKDSALIAESHQRDLGLTLVDEDAKNIQEAQQVRCQKLLTSKKLESRWTQEQTSRRLYQCLVNIRTLVEDDEHDYFEIGKYYLQVIELSPRIPVSDPALQFMISLSDLPDNIILEFISYGEEDRNYILRQAVGEIFRNLFPYYFERSIADLLEIRLEK